MTIGTGEIFSFFEIAIATGAIIRTVATLSTNAEITPANNDRKMVTIQTLPDFSSSVSAMRIGIFDSIKKKTITIIPNSMSSTLKFRTDGRFAIGTIPVQMNSSAAAAAAYTRYFCIKIITT